MIEQKSNLLFEETVFYRNSLRPKVNFILAVLFASAFLYFSSNVYLRSLSFFFCVAAFWELFLMVFFKTKIEVSSNEIKVSSTPFNNVKIVFWKEVQSANGIRMRYLDKAYPKFGYGKAPIFNAGCAGGIRFNLRDGNSLRLGIKNAAGLDTALRKIFSRKA